MANQNANDGISIIEIADGTLSEIHEMLQRANELCIKASTGTMTTDDRKLVNEELKQLKEEIERISSETQFNGQNILDGTFDLKSYTNSTEAKVTYCSEGVKPGNYSITELDIAYDENGNIDLKTAADSFKGISGNAKVTATDGNVITITDENNFEMKVEIKPGTTKIEAANVVNIQVEDFGSMDMQIGANEGQQLPIRIPNISLENMGISALDTSTEKSAEEGIDKVDNAIKFVSEVRSRLGAYQNRLEHTINSLDISSENMTAAYSRIMDVDMAEEMTEYTTLQVLSQASTSMLAQANERPSQVLQLLQ